MWATIGGFATKGKSALEITRYVVGLAGLTGVMLLSLLCAHLFFRWRLNRQNRYEKPLQPNSVD